MINFHGPLNSLSFGHVSFSLLRELFKRGREVNVFLAQEPPQMEAFKLDPEFQFWLTKSAKQAREKYSADDTTLRVWHAHSGAELQVGRHQKLFTFHELDTLTPLEINTLKNQETVFLSSKYSCDVAAAHGLTNVVYCPLGFDDFHFHPIERRDRPIQFSIFGKFENRKHTGQVINTWCKLFGGNPKYQLNTHVTNPFFKPEQNVALLQRAFGGEKPSNVNVVPYVKTLEEFNACLNNTDIVIDMSGGEGFSLPSFSALCLGKHGVINNCTAMKDWASDGGATLVEPTAKIPSEDGVFFRAGAPQNQGNLFNFNLEGFVEACKAAVVKFELSPVNKAGLTLPDTYNYARTLDIIESDLKP